MSRPGTFQPARLLQFDFFSVLFSGVDRRQGSDRRKPFCENRLVARRESHLQQLLKRFPTQFHLGSKLGLDDKPLSLIYSALNNIVTFLKSYATLRSCELAEFRGGCHVSIFGGSFSV